MFWCCNQLSVFVVHCWSAVYYRRLYEFQDMAPSVITECWIGCPCVCVCARIVFEIFFKMYAFVFTK